MARHFFKPDKEYAGRLLAARQRPVENRDRNIALLRLEFEIFSIEAQPPRLGSLGTVACRDLVLTPRVADDTGVAPFVQAIGVRQPQNLKSWLGAKHARKWVKICFGAVDPEDERNQFKTVEAFSPQGFEVREFDLALGEGWVTSSAAAGELGVSIATLHRMIKRHLPTWGSRLEQRTEGNHRRINLLLLCHLTDAQLARGQGELVLKNEIQDLRTKNRELRRRIEEYE